MELSRTLAGVPVASTIVARSVAGEEVPILAGRSAQDVPLAKKGASSFLAMLDKVIDSTAAAVMDDPGLWPGYEPPLLAQCKSKREKVQVTWAHEHTELVHINPWDWTDLQNMGIE